MSAIDREKSTDAAVVGPRDTDSTWKARTSQMRRSYHVLTDDWAEYYTYDPEYPPLWDGGCSFYSIIPTCPDTEHDLIPFLDPDDPEHLLQAHAICLDAEYGAGRWRPAEIPYDEAPDDYTDD